MKSAALLAIALSSCAYDGAAHAYALDYSWDDRRVLCSDAVDDMSHEVSWGYIEDQMKFAAAQHNVLLLHAHTPGETVSRDAIERVLSMADAHHLAYFTFRDLVPGMPRAGLAFAFDDNAPAAWLSVQDMLAAHGAHVTYFVTRWATMTNVEHEQVHKLADAGHDIEPHSVHHLHAPAYVADHGLEAYMADEVAPSFTALAEAGFAPATTYAYPFGDHTPDIDDAVLEIVGKVRTTPGQCPW